LRIRLPDGGSVISKVGPAVSCRTPAMVATSHGRKGEEVDLFDHAALVCAMVM
jgi:hypothetical protein